MVGQVSSSHILVNIPYLGTLEEKEAYLYAPGNTLLGQFYKHVNTFRCKIIDLLHLR